MQITIENQFVHTLKYPCEHKYDCVCASDSMNNGRQYVECPYMHTIYSVVGAYGELHEEPTPNNAGWMASG